VQQLFSGQIRYFSHGAAVPGVDVRVTGSQATVVATDDDGHFAVDGIPGGTWTLAPERSGADDGGAISALDAAAVLQAATGLRPLDAGGAIACDVTGDGTVNILDASRLLQYKLGGLARLPVTQQCGAEWTFVPGPHTGGNSQSISPLVSPTACTRGAVRFESVASPVTGPDFDAILVGDCNGSWRPGVAAARASTTEPTVQIGAPKRSGRQQVRVPLSVSGAGAFYAVDVDVRYDPARLRPKGARSLGHRDGRLVELRVIEPGHLRLALASATSLAAERDPVLVLTFVGDRDAVAQVSIQGAVDDRPAAVTRAPSTARRVSRRP
jgi:hypothetical protein